MDITSSKLEAKKLKYAKRMAFSQFIKQHTVQLDTKEGRCCGEKYSSRDLHRHVSSKHGADIDTRARDILENGSDEARWSQLFPVQQTEACGEDGEGGSLPVDFTADCTFPWLPKVMEDGEKDEEEGRVLLFYTYREIANPPHVCSWQKELCCRLRLTGKIRVASEGLNATVAGSVAATQVYMDSVRAHPLFSHLTHHTFKTSPGNRDVFPDGLRVGVYAEACPMGLSQNACSHTGGGEHLTPEGFHQVAEALASGSEKANKSVLVDCRNFYESRVGQFEGALTPNIRKFSYWPEYVDENMDLFRGKDVYMYCTGGIRCERGSAYLKAKGVCSNVYQLEGGIHKYIEKFPDGHFRGKLFVFDDRYTVKANEDVLSTCVYCGQPWDQYQPCSSKHCHQLVLSCDQCRHGNRTACCTTCQQQGEAGQGREECECTRARPRVPQEKIDSL